MKKLLFCVACALGATLASSTASAQGFAPPEGSVWVKLGYIYSRASNNFAGNDELRFASQDPNNTIDYGDKVPFRSREGQVVGGTLYEHQATLDVVWAPIDRFVLVLNAPLQKYVNYSNDTNGYTTEAQGFGDVKLSAGYQLTPRDQYRIGATFYLGAKIPTSSPFPYTNEAILSEGQVDFSGTMATTFKLIDGLYLNGIAELKYRTEWPDSTDTRGADPGNELHTSLGFGGAPVQNVWLTAGWSGFWGQMWDIRAPEFPGTPRVRRRYHAVVAGAYIDFGKWIGADGLALDIFGKYPFAGQDHAAIWSTGAGLAYQF